ncbi:hypothetical protein NPIL_91771 [Nephila pilipes]|uniref:Uncharacterized protein n=1 Tax=Nephila pilipes TaxID=299642 RepID=A0A8X6NX88_NEPPI|nr:hypothetical protein NPIL_91771 [Nephila pilipes]
MGAEGVCPDIPAGKPLVISRAIKWIGFRLRHQARNDTRTKRNLPLQHVRPRALGTGRDPRTKIPFVRRDSPALPSFSMAMSKAYVEKYISHVHLIEERFSKPSTTEGLFSPQQ